MIICRHTSFAAANIEDAEHAIVVISRSSEYASFVAARLN